MSTDPLMAAPPTGDLKRRTVRGVGVTVSAQAVKFALQTASTMVLGRLLAPADFGLIAMAAAVTGFASLFKDLGVSAAIIQRPQITQAEISNLFWVNFGFSLLLAMVTAALAPIISRFYGEPRLGLITVVIALTFLPGGVVVQPQALLRRQMRFMALASLEISAQALGLVVGIVAAWCGAGYWALLLLQWTNTLWYLVAVWVICRWWPDRWQRGVKIRPLLAFGSNLTGASILSYINTNVDQVLIGRLFGSEVAGNYSRAYALLLLPLQQLIAPVAAVAIPALSRLVGHPAQFRRAFLRIFELTCLVALPAIAVMMATSDWLVMVALGPQWATTARIFAVLGLLAFAQVFSSAAWLIFVTQGQTKRLFHWSVGNTGLVLAGLAAGIPWGAMGVATAYAVSGILIRIPIFLWVAGRVGPVTTGDFYRVGGPYLLLALAMGMALRVIRAWWTGPGHPLVSLALFSLLGIGFYLLALVGLPSGRRALRNVGDVLRMVRGTTATETTDGNA